MLSYTDLQRIFSRDVLISLAEHKQNGLYDLAMSEFKSKSPRDLYDRAFNSLLHNYKNEFVFTNLIFQKIFISRHKLSKSVLLNELRIGTAKADIVILNGSSCVYEVKSDVDNLTRLQHQLSQYLQAFDYVYIVINQNRVHELGSAILANIGIIVLTKNNTLKTIRTAISNKCNVNPAVLFETLRKDEYSRIIKQEFGFLPNVPNTRFFSECKKMFCTIQPDKAHDLFVTALKQRMRYSSYLQSTIKRYPPFLQYPVMKAGFTDNQISDFYSYINDHWRK